LDNAKFAAWYSELLARRGKSDRAIKSELYSKGVNREVVEQALQDGEDLELERLQLVIAKKARLSRYKNDPQKLRQYLAAQGFSWGNIKTALPVKKT
jgi:SOS response regulatory protein OraA/RecX